MLNRSVCYGLCWTVIKNLLSYINAPYKRYQLLSNEQNDEVSNKIGHPQLISRVMNILSEP